MKDPETGKRKTAMGKLIGRIIPRVEFRPNDDWAKREAVTCFDYGEYLLACLHAKEDFNLLKKNLKCKGEEDIFLIQDQAVNRDLFRQVQERNNLQGAEHRYWAITQGFEFVMLHAWRIDSRILKDANMLKMTRKELVSFIKFLKLNDN